MGLLRFTNACWVLGFVVACGEPSASPESPSTSDGNLAQNSTGNPTAATTGVGPTTSIGPGSTGNATAGSVTGTSGGVGVTGGGTGGAGTTGGTDVTAGGDGSVTGTPVTATTGGGPDVPEPTLVTSGPGAYWVEGELTEGGSSASITIDESMALQTWRGFGGTFNEMGWDALGVLDPAERDRAMRLLFSDTEGAGFDWGRIPMGASDYALERYTLAETPDDFEMTNFSIERDKQYLIPYIQAALAVKPGVALWATPWSPPAWMKDSNNINGTDEFNSTPTFESHMLSDTQILEAYALYFARFIEEYAALGLTIQHVQPQNEPGYATRYPSCLWDTNLLGTFVGSYLGPTLEERGLDTEIWFGTLSNDATDPQMI